MFTTAINCPACGQGQILIEPHALLAGHGFSCPTCQAKLAMSSNSTALFSQSLQAYDKLKQQLQGQTS